MIEKLGRLRSALICGAAFCTIIVLLKLLPGTIGHLFATIALFGSPLIWIDFMLALPPTSTPPALRFAAWSGTQFLVYGLLLGFLCPLKSRGGIRIIGSVAIRFLLVLLVVLSHAIWMFSGS